MASTNRSNNNDVLKMVAELLVDLKRRALGDDPTPQALGQAIGTAVRSFTLLAAHTLRPVSKEFPSSIQYLLTLPDPPLDPSVDAFLDPHDFITFIGVVDLLLVKEHACVAPHLHLGWQDKTQSCRQARETTTKRTGIKVGQEQAPSLLFAASIHNRTCCVPGPVTFDRSQAIRALLDLTRLLESLAQSTGSKDLALACRSAREQMPSS